MEEAQSTQNNKQGKKNIFAIVITCIILASPVISCIVSLFTVHSATGMLRCGVSLLILSGLLALALYRGVKGRELLFDNRENLIRFVFAYISCVFIASLSALFPEFTVPIASLALIAAFLSNIYCGVICALIFSAEPFLITEKSFEYFLFEIALSVIVIILVLAGREEKKKAAEPVILFTLIYVTLYTALIVLKRMTIVPSLVINPIVGLLLNDILIFLTIKLVARNIIFAYEEKYFNIVDPEYPLLTELKKKDKTEYKRAIHTAYICDRISDKLGFDRTLMKGAGFYHRIGVLSDESDDIAFETVRLLRHEGFPDPLIRLLSEYGNTDIQEISAEVSLICIVDTLIYDILKRMEKGEEDIDYEKLVDSVINKLLGTKNGRLIKSNLMIQHLYKIRKYLKEEKLYYDFLR